MKLTNVETLRSLVVSMPVKFVPSRTNGSKVVLQLTSEGLQIGGNLPGPQCYGNEHDERGHAS